MSSGTRARRPAAGHTGPRPDYHVIVLFGATGDLAKRKLLPGLYHLYVAGLLPEEFRVIGSAPPEFALSDADFETLRGGVTEFVAEAHGE